MTTLMAKKPLAAGYSVRAWASKIALEKYRVLSEKTGMSQAEIMTRVLEAAADALPPDRIMLPLKFKVETPALVPKTNCNSYSSGSPNGSRNCARDRFGRYALARHPLFRGRSVR